MIIIILHLFSSALAELLHTIVITVCTKSASAAFLELYQLKTIMQKVTKICVVLGGFVMRPASQG